MASEKAEPGAHIGSDRKSMESAPLHDAGDSPDDLYVLALDVGSTMMRGHVYDRQGRIKGSSSVKLEVEQPKLGWVEMDPHKLFEDAKTVLRDSMGGQFSERLYWDLSPPDAPRGAGK
ncbi:hypothetical protein ACOMHN_025629 [Nucella lapillus]